MGREGSGDAGESLYGRDKELVLHKAGSCFVQWLFIHWLVLLCSGDDYNYVFKRVLPSNTASSVCVPD